MFLIEEDRLKRVLLQFLSSDIAQRVYNAVIQDQALAQEECIQRIAELCGNAQADLEQLLEEQDTEDA